MAHQNDYQPEQSGKAESSDIYGTDDNTFALSIAADALDPAAGVSGINQADFWASTIDQAAKSKGVDESGAEGEVKVMRGDKVVGNDDVKVSVGGQRHRRGMGVSDK